MQAVSRRNPRDFWRERSAREKKRVERRCKHAGWFKARPSGLCFVFVVLMMGSERLVSLSGLQPLRSVAAVMFCSPPAPGDTSR